jgi:hypothetical protein
VHTSRIAFATFAPEHLDGAVLLSRQAGWPHRREDWATVLALSTGFVAPEGDRDIAALARPDRSACGVDRAPLIALLSEQGRIAVRRHEGRPTGFATLRAFGRGRVAGPVVAATADDARAPLSFLFATRPGAFLRVDTTAARGLAPWLAAQGLAHVGGGIAMRRGGGEAPDRQTGVQTFALASQALG